MSSQGTGPPSQTHGMKNTSDPRAKDPTEESAGPVASDSLAAESYNEGGGFSENRNAAPSGVTGEASTFKTTDTSAATKLDAAQDAGDRDDGYDASQRGPGGVKYAEGLGGQPDFPGTTSSQGYSGGPTGGNYSRGDNSTSSSDNTGSDSTSAGASGNDYSSSGAQDTTTSSNVDAAPTYVADVYLGENSKPKGKDLTEDENLDGNRKADFEIGSKNDPGRAAIQNFESANATGQSNVQREIDGGNTYGDLKSNENA